VGRIQHRIRLEPGPKHEIFKSPTESNTTRVYSSMDLTYLLTPALEAVSELPLLCRQLYFIVGSKPHILEIQSQEKETVIRWMRCNVMEYGPYQYHHIILSVTNHIKPNHMIIINIITIITMK
jgi:hypothetical protein